MQDNVLRDILGVTRWGAEKLVTVRLESFIFMVKV